MSETDTKLEERAEAIALDMERVFNDILFRNPVKSNYRILREVLDRAVLSSPTLQQIIAEAVGRETERCLGIAEGELARVRALADQLTGQIDAQDKPSTSAQQQTALTLDAMASAAIQITHDIRAQPDADAGSVSVGESWQVVPKEPTEQMLRAAIHEGGEDADALNVGFSIIYAAMLAAAPPPPKSVVSGEGVANG